MGTNCNRNQRQSHKDACVCVCGQNVRTVPDHVLLRLHGSLQSCSGHHVWSVSCSLCFCSNVLLTADKRCLAVCVILTCAVMCEVSTELLKAALPSLVDSSDWHK